MFNKFNLTFLLILLTFTPFSVFGQPDLTKKIEAYQNQHRAYNLSLLKNDIKSLEDAPMRCFLYAQIMKFIFDNKIKSYHDVADAFALECLEDVKNNSSQFSVSQASFWKSTMISLLRVNSPDVAVKAERKYFADDQDSGLSDLRELELTKNYNDVANRIISKVIKGEIPDDIFPIFIKLREKDQSLSFRLLDVLLGFFETTPNLDRFDTTLNFLSQYYLDKSTPLEIKKRFLNFSVNLGQKVLLESDTSGLFQQAKYILEVSLPEINKSVPTLYSQALLIYATLEGKVNKKNREREEVYKRIELSDNKLHQTISEAEAAEDKILKNDLWMSAARLALNQKKIKLAVDLIMKIESEVEVFNLWRTHFLLNDVLTKSLKEEDFESAEYTINNIENLSERGSGILKIAAKFLELEDKTQAFEKIEEALKVLEKAERNQTKIRTLLSAVPTTLKIDKAKAFNITSLAIKEMNRLPTPSIDDKLGTDSRKKYVDSILLPTSFNLNSAFKLLAKEDVVFTYATSQEIDLKAWRLATQIIAETEKKYPYNQEQDKDSAQKQNKN